ncbi:hypothetical protein LTR91_002515 [Friedmanniomyces endolithicus]|uniref:protein O-GlcNAc transferase n=1 Tax=Friedmanniomyces endolithicus TaxID=329885 RepID=A0AAN6FNP6_9PEZI|nr:hypothetical protein LTR82_007221 [Friedmanniomyces endolithicus]KAK0920836.1 hypothetical protein LTR57_009321 [Friedmanniomyces endolithicus]KAK1010680.1 hypothetical protein LTR91_002515 [Friedmanniomyces endolithicus]KAK1028186.1 hypothetical protein LTS16_020827 [Friedmanniomyces endolithicus]
MSMQQPHDSNFPPSSIRSGLRVQPGDMPHFAPQYALPIHRELPRRDSDGSSLGSGEETPRAENTLRRKTPNGTLNAGYDGTVEYANPQKHQLVVTQGSSESYVPAGSGRQTFLQHQQRQSSSHAEWNAPAGVDSYAPQYQQAYSLPAMDSMLRQMPMQYIYAQQLYGQTVPSVIQPSFPYLGPTASGGQGSGPYGPYWHDGTFVPYRPAALRDPYLHYRPSANWTSAHPSSHSLQQAQYWQQQTQAGHWAPRPTSDLTYPPTDPQDRSTLPTAHSGGTSVPYPHQPDNAAYLSDDGEINPVAATPNFDADFGPSPPNARRRDETFAWALQQYQDLIAFIHHHRRHQQHVRNPVSQQAPRQAFYPRPPKPSYSGPQLDLEKQRTAPGSQASGDLLEGPHGTSGTNGAGDIAQHHGTTRSPSRPRPASLWSPSGVHFRDNEYNRRASDEQRQRPFQQQQQAQYQNQPYSAYHDHDQSPTLRRSSGSTVSSIVNQMPPDDSPRSRASVALSYLTKLCQEADWRWTDGMLLGGCLAYGLGNHQQAHRWYTKVLGIDPTHLEATSNLAATLLALGRRREAEQHWANAVKAAPNHFEAVEHLVGLLCSEHRSADAVRVIEYVQSSLRQPKPSDGLKASDRQSECSSSSASRSPSRSELSDRILYDFDTEGDTFTADWRENPAASEPGFGSSGFAVPGCDNGRILALIHAKGNMLYSLGDNPGAARAFEDAVLIATGRKFENIQGIVKHVLSVVSAMVHRRPLEQGTAALDPLLLGPEQALATAKMCFPHYGELPGLQHVPGGHQSIARRAIISTTSNSLLSLAKIFQDGMSNSARASGVTPLACGVRDILALYYLSLSLQPSPSTANNVGILLASVQQAASPAHAHPKIDIPGVVPGSGIALALQYYNYGLQLDQHHAHLYTNLGSLLKDIGQLDAAINMYERAVKCDGKFDIALANLANAVKDKGRTGDAIIYYKRAVEVSPDFAEAVCGLANALNSVCGWKARGGIAEDGGKRDRWHVDDAGMLLDARQPGATSSGWIKRVVDIVEKQLTDGETWGRGVLTPEIIEQLVQQVVILDGSKDDVQERQAGMRRTLESWAGQRWEGARVTKLVERATRRIGWYRYRDTYVKKKQRTPSSYNRPQLPATLTVPPAPTVLPFHTFTCPLSAKQIRTISQRNGMRISVSTLRAPWLPKQVFQPPKPPSPHLKVGYVSSDFNNHPLAHLMQSVFGLHNRKRVEAYCYATTASDKSVHREQIESEAPVFRDASSWSAERLVHQIVHDGIHILVNLNGYTRGARNEVFAARPAPIQMSFMGFAGTLGAEWCDYLLADETSIPPETLRPWRRNIDVEDVMVDDTNGSEDGWVYGENIIYCRDTFFCCDHKQSAPGAHDEVLSWKDEQRERWRMRKELFPQISDETLIFGNFNQLYKIDPTIFRTWLRILARVPNSILWLLRFPDLGESYLLATARQWAGAEVASRVVFTDVAPKHLHISRARTCDLVLDTAECNAHTTAADVLWSGTPLLTLPRYAYKMCSRMAASILKGALPDSKAGVQAARELIATSEEDYEEKAVGLALSLAYTRGCEGRAAGRLMELRKMLYHARWTSALFDTKRWVSDLEDAYEVAWMRFVSGEGGDIWLDKVPRKGAKHGVDAS